jgi:hypothetical protein
MLVIVEHFRPVQIIAGKTRNLYLAWTAFLNKITLSPDNDLLGPSVKEVKNFKILATGQRVIEQNTREKERNSERERRVL